MKFLLLFLSLVIFVLTTCATLFSVDAAENSQSYETAAIIESFLNEKLAAAFYLDSKFPDKTALGSDKLYEDIGVFKDDVLNDPNLTKEGRLATSKKLIQALVSLDGYEDALDLCRDFSNRYPESKDDIIRLYYLTGFCCQESSRYDQAIGAYQKALLYSSKGDFTNYIRTNLGWCYYKKGEYDKAINEFSRALNDGLIDPEAAQWAWFHMGRCRFFLKNYEDAIIAFRQAVKVDPDTKLAQQAKTNIEDMERFNKGATL